MEEFSFLRILREFSRVARRTCRNFLEFSSLYSNSLAHTCPACLLILFHSGDIQVLEKCTQLTNVLLNNCGKITGGCCFEERSFLRLRPSALFWKKFLLSESCSNFSSGSQNLQKFPGNFLALIELSRSLTPALPTLSILFHTGDIQALGNCTQLTSVNFYRCEKITGGSCFGECSFSRLRPMCAFFWKNFFLSESCANFLEWLVELGEIS